MSVFEEACGPSGRQEAHRWSRSRCCSRLLSPPPPSGPRRIGRRRRSAAARSAPSPRPSPIRASPPLLARRGTSAQQRFPLHAGLGLRRAQPRRPGRGARPRRSRRPRRARDAGPTSASAVTAITPSSYNLGVSVGWRRFAMSGDVAQSDGGLIAGMRESAQVGMSYRATRRLTGRVAVGAERAEGAPAHHRRGSGLFARRRRRLFDRPQRRCHRRRPLPHRPRPARAAVRATSAATARRSMSGPPSASRRPAQASIPAQP